jgi:hypothetical protein
MGLVVVASVGLASTPTLATGEGRLARAQARLDAIADEIGLRASALSEARAALVLAEGRVEAATSRLAFLQAARRRLDAEVDRAAARLDALQARLDEVAAEAFMGTGGGGGPDLELIDAVLSAGSFSEIGDRVTFAGASGTRLAESAHAIATARADLEVRRAAIGATLAGQRLLVGQVTQARADAGAAVAVESAATTALEASRERALAVIRRLGASELGSSGLDLGGVASSLQGAESVTYGRWARLLLRVLDAPVCRSNLVAVVSWQVAESTQAAWNPLATTHRMDGSTDFNPVGVQNYRSLAQGLRATVETIDFGWDVYRYGPIVTSLRRCARPIETARAINASSWCPGCVDGRYVLNIVPRVDADLEAYLHL